MTDSDESFESRAHLDQERTAKADEPQSWRSLFYKVVWRELPYFVMLSLAIFGIGYVSFTGNPSDFIWMSLVPVFGVMCVVGGWRHTKGKDDRWRLIWTQALHWLAFFIVMNLIYMPEVRSVANNNAAGLNLMTMLALATFVAGIHAQAWQICGVGLILALAVPIVAWVEQSALIFLVIAVGLVFIAASIWLAMHKEIRRASEDY
jgi:hypothetical protein